MLFIRNVTFVSADPRRLGDFWAAALSLTERRDDEMETIIADAEWTHPRLTVQKVEDAPVGPNRLHLDVTADDRRAEIDRLTLLGADEQRSVTTEAGWTWTVMTDPDGNEFCVTDP